MNEQAPGLIAGLLLALFLLLLVLRIRRAVRSGKAQTRARRASGGEARAKRLLVDLGFEMLGEQVTCDYEILVDGIAHAVRLRADCIVSKDGFSYVAEVKTGEVAPNVGTAATRRQLLEYRVAFGVDGVLLVDGDTGRVSHVVFPGFEGDLLP